MNRRSLLSYFLNENYTYYRSKCLLYLFSFLLLGCNTTNQSSTDKLFHIPLLYEGTYDLKNPIDKFFLPYVLEEISGLSFIENGVLACVQDEKGSLFFYNTNTREISKAIKFGKSGDYEGVEIVGDTAYSVNSNGEIFQFSINEKTPQVKIYKTPLSKRNNVEGLGFDIQSNSLLILCKSGSNTENLIIEGKAVFGFDIKGKKMNPKPVFSISKYDMKTFFETNKETFYDVKRINFKPSGIALHPIQDKYYVLAHIGKMLLVVNRNGSIEASYPIPPRLLGQPEGICFAPNGDMFIASEGEGDKGYILKFEME